MLWQYRTPKDTLIFLRAIWGIDASNGLTVFVLFQYTISALSSQSQIRYLILFTDCKCCPSEIAEPNTSKVIKMSGLLFQKAGEFPAPCPQDVALYQELGREWC